MSCVRGLHDSQFGVFSVATAYGDRGETAARTGDKMLLDPLLLNAKAHEKPKAHMSTIARKASE